MDTWLSMALRVIQHVIRAHSGNAAEMVGVTLIGLVALLLVMKAMTSASGTYDSGWTRRGLAVLTLFLTLVNAAVATALYVLPRVHNATADKVMTIAIPLGALLFVATPLMGYIMRTRYAVTLTATAVSLLACVAVFLAANAIVDSFNGGNRGFAVVKHRTQTLDRFITGN